ncbi:hypothetical protein BKH23_02245 [Actinomyces oris]|uniref:Uncharacterized protein n=1 Tax=Actinomyces oris TaxID=544580 RepID=A0A1Q8WC03_9ACTO|nr:hypothetical protein BKH22_09040 [Actinomyces oris]OLO63783.1 hypothetical protein BKH23_02245 [Actinomyces oris]OLO66979.1 hypothetical protein BKH21_08025 [Actinomyces oris]OLO68532.1 hypothetical protein BKH20_08920 [Actinomyces oris]
MERDPLILDSAHRHGVSDEDILHALRFPVRHFVQDDSMTMFIGADKTGILVEVGVIEWHGVIAVAHAMRPARSKYLR